MFFKWLFKTKKKDLIDNIYTYLTHLCWDLTLFIFVF